LPQRVINEQPDKTAVQKEIAGLLERIVVLYQIPNWGTKNAIILSEWIMDNYKFETLETIKACLKNPPPTKDPNWRLTPDTINAWFEVELEKQAELLEREHQKRKEKELRLSLTENIDTEFKLTDEQKANIDKYANDFLESIKKIDVRPMRPITEEEVKIEGAADFDAYKEWKRKNGYL
jgi:hypothetical protein